MPLSYLRPILRSVFSIFLLMVFQQPSLADEGRRVALLTGISEYDSPKLHRLRFAEADVTAIADKLKELGFETIVILGRDLPAGRPAATYVREQIANLTTRLDKSDTLVIGFSGHGVTLEGDSPNERTGKSPRYFCLKDSQFDRLGTRASARFWGE